MDRPPTIPVPTVRDASGQPPHPTAHRAQVLESPDHWERTQHRRRRILPWMVFAIGFTLTTGVGATIIGLTNGQRWGLDVLRHEMMGLNVDILNDSLFANDEYWWLLAACILIPLAGALVAGLLPLSRIAIPDKIVPFDQVMAVARLIYALGILWLMLRILLLVPDARHTILGAWTGELEEHYRVRILIMSLLSPKEFGLAYTGLLTLITLPLYNALVARRSVAAWAEITVWLTAYWLLAVVLVQKLLISFSLLLVGLSLCTVSNILGQWKRMLVILLMFLGLIHFVMSTLLPSWTIVSTFDHIIGRSADSYPYAILIAPKHDFGYGQYLVGSVLGGPALLGETISPNVEIYDLMYPETEGAIALAAPVWSYVDVGLPGALLTLGLIVLLCGFISYLARHVMTSPWGWAVYLLLLVQIYHLTQMPFLGVLFWGYAAPHGLTVLALVWLLSVILGPSSVSPADSRALKPQTLTLPR